MAETTETPDELYARLRPKLEQAAALHQAEDLDAAAALYDEILREDPTNPDALNLVAVIAQQRGYPSLAVDFAARSIAARPYFGSAHSTYGLGLLTTGQIHAGMAELWRAIRLEPGLMAAHANLIFSLDLDPGVTLTQARSARHAFQRQFVTPLENRDIVWPNDPLPEKQLTIGYLSNDFRRHSSATSAWPAIRHHDFERYNIVLFDSSKPPGRDDVHARFMALPAQHHDVFGMSDQAVADLIRSCGVDVLVDLTGYAGGTRLMVLARRPAPVQIEGWAYIPDTTGLSCFDGIFADQYSLPPGCPDRDGFTEQPILLPSFMPYEPLIDMPEVGPPPFERNGYLTFGYLGRAGKLNDRVLSAWAEILTRAPDARLLIKSAPLDDESYAFAIRDPLVACGVEDARIEIRGGSGMYEHASAYNEVDVALDSWPQNGGVTTLEASFMGVPTLTLKGDRMGGRMGAAIQLGCDGDDLSVFPLVEEYVNAAVYMAHAVRSPLTRLGHHLKQRRSGLRSGLQRSPFMSGRAYTVALEDAYREVWRAWCRKWQ